MCVPSAYCLFNMMIPSTKLAISEPYKGGGRDGMDGGRGKFVLMLKKQ